MIVAPLFGQTKAAGLLVKHGAELEAKNNDGSTAFLVAVFFCHPDTLKLLLKNGQTPLDTDGIALRNPPASKCCHAGAQVPS